MDVSIIIINYNTKQITADCINSIFCKTEGIDFEVIVVDNASMDGSVELFSKDKRIIFIENNKNIGFGRANNIGFNISKGKYIFLLNSDTYLLNNAIKLFYDDMEILPNNVSCIGTILSNKYGRYSHSFGNFLSIIDLVLGLKNKFCSNKNVKIFEIIPFEVPVIIGADLFIRRNLVQEFTLFDPAFFMYNEENDLQRRFALYGYKSLIIHGPQIVHLEGKSSQYTKISIQRARGCFIYMRKWNTISIYLVYRVMYFIIQFPKIFLPHVTLQHKILFLKTLLFYRAPKSNYFSI